jgi:hypothetical protein
MGVTVGARFGLERLRGDEKIKMAATTRKYLIRWCARSAGTSDQAEHLLHTSPKPL